MKTFKTALSVAAVSIAACLSTATPASAATADNGVCETYEICWYYNSGYRGGVADFTQADARYDQNDTFHGTGGQINNNIASGKNRNPGYNAIGWQYYNWTGWAFTLLASGDPNCCVSELPGAYKNAISSHSHRPYGT
ncbi:peptidase inhibitor family I36 protein [Streptomyces sp. WMMC940]|uniref:peptidase inhibitor family I36 protein n=1 Tax=Streptomyces sp. WMMC940 TaxID=3015153 RepID=UPI0022B6C4B6|nr:peptidase inhibitor family I36 protein [Streptomyces sp. WMMC940]MCZ7460638.1 peptidase inhibitor family I36 protein [Streptomyces sp. WMMC940]